MLLVGGSRKFVSDSAQPDATDRTVAAATTPSSYSSESLLAGPQLYHCRYLRPGRSCAPAFANYVNSRKMGFPETGFSAQRRVPKTRRDRNLAPAMRDWLTKSEKDPVGDWNHRGRQSHREWIHPAYVFGGSSQDNKGSPLTGCKPSRRGKCFRTMGIACTRIAQDRPPVLAD